MNNPTVFLELEKLLPSIINGVLLLSGGIMMVAMVRAKMEILIQRLGNVEDEFNHFAAHTQNSLDRLTEVMIEQAKHDQRLISVEADIRELKGRCADALAKLQYK